MLSEKTALNEKIEALRQKNAEMNDENMAKRLEYGRESALLEQQMKFLNNHIEELQREKEDAVRRYED